MGEAKRKAAKAVQETARAIGAETPGGGFKCVGTVSQPPHPLGKWPFSSSF